ncbi:protein TIC 40, chloroplastic-like isoform X1 [Coffea arabica]|uniref:Protein TIC 40, chloroplastic-like isoform X1 n=1 Tax=Coffea arabica TaxID=13443 RepID=A0ABM4VZL1_COFAR|nr:protein TIC 40, chloroplastic-like isoform X1 [Coffea arabica]
MENSSLVCSPKMVLGLSQNPKNSIFNKPFLGFPQKPSSISSNPRKPSTSLLPFPHLPVSRRGKTLVLVKLKGDCFASTTSSSNQQTSSVGVNPLPVQPPPSSVGSPLFWIGVGVGFSALFSWVATNLKKYAMQQAFKTMMGQMNTQSNQFGNDGFPFPFPYASSAASATASSPPTASATATSPSQVASQPVTVDVSASKVEEPPATDIKDDSEPRKEAKRYAFVDVFPEETFQKNAFESYKESAEADSFKEPVVIDYGTQNGAASKPEEGASQASSSNRQANPLLSVDALEQMMEDPTVQKMIFPYLPKEMREPATFKWMLQNPAYRQQLQDMLNKMGGSPEWDNQMVDTLKNFDLNSPEVKQQFDQIGLTPEEVISKIMANPDVAMAFQNPRIQAAIMDCSQNPLSIAKYQNDKEVMDVFNKISELFPGVTGSQ